MRRDPIPRFKNKLIQENIMTNEEAEEIDHNVIETVEESAKFAIESPYPKPEDALEDVFVKLS
jgi:pyruvate dehydrogenase E1 component alpha subunit